jgi:hypothetical protein
MILEHIINNILNTNENSSINIIVVKSGDSIQFIEATADTDIYYLNENDNTGHVIVTNNVFYNLTNGSVYSINKSTQYAFGNFGIDAMILLKVEHK